MGPVQKITSGGQTGVDRAALDAAIALGIPHGGFCPKGRLAEDGTIPAEYPMTETESETYEERTEMNVIHSDGTLILHRGKQLFGGTAYTAELAKSHKKPLLILSLSKAEAANQKALLEWLKQCGIHTLNVAGPRESSQPGAYAAAFDFLKKALKD